MAIFEDALKITLENEGSYVNDPDDLGGETKYGISKRSYPNLDISKLTLDDVKKIYKKDYWDIIKGDEIIEQSIANKLFDLAVNIGNKPAVILIQRAVRAACGKGIKEDGCIGFITLSAINCCQGDVLLASLKSEAAAYYRALNNKKYEAGWLHRAYS